MLVKQEKQTDLRQLNGPIIYVANHVSYLDIMFSYIIIPNYFVFMGKQELNSVPLFRIFFRKMNILVDRKSRVGSHKALVEIGKKIDKGQSAFLFPEGTISSGGKLKNFKNGAFKLAIEKQIPIVAITYLNNWKLLQNGGFFKSHGKPGIARVVVHQPIATKGLSENDLVPLRERVFELISNDLEKYENR